MINYISANDGGLEFHTGNGGAFLVSRDINELVGFALDHGFAETVMGSSSMDFASEYGFETNEGADELLEKVFRRVAFVTEGVV